MVKNLYENRYEAIYKLIDQYYSNKKKKNANNKPYSKKSKKNAKNKSYKDHQEFYDLKTIEIQKIK